MATVYLKKVASSSRSEWTSGTSYVVGDRVWIEDASMVVSFTNLSGAQNRNSIRTYVCIKDTSSTDSPLTNSTDWTEAGTKEYPYHSVDGNLTDSTASPESYLESEQDRAHTSSNNGSLFHHLRRGESGYSLGKLIFLADEENPLFKITKRATFNQFEVEPDPSIKRIRFILINGNVGSNTSHNDLDSTFGRVNKCDFYYSGNVPQNNIIGGIYDNLSKLEFNECYFGPGSKVGYSDPSNFYLDFANRNFVGLDKCTIDFPNHDSHYISYDGQKHSIGIRPYIKNSTIRFKRFKASILINNSYIDISNSIAYVDSLEKDALTYTNNATFTQNIAENFIVFVKDESTHTLDVSPGVGFTGTVTKIDPQFVDDSGDYRLRPSSPLIGGLKEDNSQKTLLEKEYPEGKWFDSHAAAGGDGSWETPYNSYADAIDSFTGDEAVVLIKEGQHSLHAGYWSRTYTGGNSAWNPSHDLPKAYPNGIKFIGMGSGSIFDTSGDGISNYGAFWSYNDVNPNIRDTPFVFKDFDILMNNSSFMNRGMICARRAEYVNVNVTQAPDLGATNSQLFDYTTHSGSGNSGEYLKMSGCTINVSLSKNATGSTFLVGNGGGLKQFQSCTFADLNRTTSRVDSAPDSFISYDFGSYTGSFIKDCIIYSTTTNTRHFGTSPTNSSSTYQGSLNLEIKNVAVYSTNQTVAVGSNFGDKVSTIDPKFVATEPHDSDFRLRPESSLIGGIKSDSTDVYYLQPGNPYNGDGSQKDASAMTADGDPGPFNEFKEIIAAGVPYGSKIIIINGTYDWSQALGQGPSANINETTWQEYAYAGYNYVAETMHKVIFDAKQGASNLFVYKPYGGATGAGVFLDLDTTFTGVQFNNIATIDSSTRNMIASVSGSAGLGSCTFKRCKFLGHISTMSAAFPWTGGGRNINSSTMHWENCEISIVFDEVGGLFTGGDGHAEDLYHGAWSWIGCTFYIPTGLTTFNGRNAANGTYVSPGQLFGGGYKQSERVFKNNIVQIENGTASIGAKGPDKLPNVSNNCFNGVSPVYSTTDHSAALYAKNNLFEVNPLFVDPSNSNFALRPLSPLIGKGK